VFTGGTSEFDDFFVLSLSFRLRVAFYERKLS